MTTTLPAWLDRTLYPFTPRTLALPDGEGRLSYLDEGRGPPILFAHGTPTWSVDWRRLIPALSRTHRCLAPDHLGFGLSERPVAADYDVPAHARRLAAFADALGLERFTLVAHDFGGPIALPLALSGRVERLILLNTFFWPVDDDPRVARPARLLGGALGRFLYRALNLSLRVLTPLAYGDRRALTPALHRQLLAPFARRRGDRVLVLHALARALLGARAHYAALWEARAPGRAPVAAGVGPARSRLHAVGARARPRRAPVGARGRGGERRPLAARGGPRRRRAGDHLFCRKLRYDENAMFFVRVCCALLGLAMAAGCDGGGGGGGTTLKLDVSASGLSIAALELAVSIEGRPPRTTTLPPGGGAPKLPGAVVLVLPDEDLRIVLALDATDDAGVHHTQTASTTSRAHQQITLTMALAPDAVVDLATPPPPPDLTTPVVADLAGADLAGVDLARVADLSPPPADLAPRDPLVQKGAIATGGNSVTATLPSPSRQGTLLVLSLGFDKGANPSGPNGWTWWIGNSTGNSASLFYLANNPGGVTSASAMLAGASASVGQLTEWDTVTVEDKGVWCWNSNQVSSLTCTTNPTTAAIPLALSVTGNYLNSAGTVTFTPGAGFTTLDSNGAVSTRLHYHLGYALGLPSATPVTDTVGGGTGTWAGVLVSFR